MRKRWLLVPLIVGALAIGVTGGLVAAHGNGTDGSSPRQSFTSKVAGILGLDEQQVQDAFDQAASEMQDEAVQLKLNHLVEDGRLTQEQADEYLEWYQSRPDSPLPGFRGPGFFYRGFRGGHGMYGMKFYQETQPTPAPTESGATSV